MLQNDSFSEYGYEYQTKLFAACLYNLDFLSQIHDVLAVEYFDSPANKWICDKILTYYHKYKTIPTSDFFVVEVKNIDDKTLSDGVKASLLQSKMFRNSVDLPYIMDSSLKFCKNQKVKRALSSAVDHAAHGNYDKMFDILKEALQAGTDRSIGMEWKEDIESRYVNDCRIPISTGFPQIDELLGGGLSGGELGIIVSDQGGGKTWWLVNFAISALKEGKRVNYYTLELNSPYIGKRIDSHMTKTSFQTLQKDVNIEEIADKIRKSIHPEFGEIVLKRFISRRHGVNDMIAHLDKCISQDKKPDLIIIDYIDLLKIEGSYKEKHDKLEDLYEEVRSVGAEYNIPVWSASQSNRQSGEENYIDKDKIAGAISKAGVCDFMMSWSRKQEDKVNGTGRVYIIKNRFGPDGIILGSTSNLDIGHIELHDYTDKSIDKMERDNRDGVKKYLLKKKQEFDGFTYDSNP